MYINIKTKFNLVTYLLFNIIKIVLLFLFFSFNSIIYFKYYNFIKNNYNLLN